MGKPCARWPYYVHQRGYYGGTVKEKYMYYDKASFDNPEDKEKVNHDDMKKEKKITKEGDKNYKNHIEC